MSWMRACTHTHTHNTHTLTHTSSYATQLLLKSRMPAYTHTHTHKHSLSLMHLIIHDHVAIEVTNTSMPLNIWPISHEPSSFGCFYGGIPGHTQKRVSVWKTFCNNIWDITSFAGLYNLLTSKRNRNKRSRININVGMPVTNFTKDLLMSRPQWIMSNSWDMSGDF